MKRGATEHPKFRKLARLMGQPTYVAIGLMESLSHWAVKFAPDSAIGKFEDDEIADGVGWASEPSAMMEMLVAAGFVDAHSSHRLVIHDWPEHCDNATQMALARAHRWFWDGTQPKLTQFDKREREPLAAFFKQSSPPDHFVATAGPRDDHAEATASPPLSRPSPPSPASPSPLITLSSEAAADGADRSIGDRAAGGRDGEQDKQKAGPSRPDTQPPAKQTRPRTKYTPEFEAAWAKYGRRGAKGAAYTAYSRIVHSLTRRDGREADTPHDWLLERIRVWRGIHSDREMLFIPHMGRWIRNSQFDFDEDAERQSAKSGDSKPDWRGERREREFSTNQPAAIPILNKEPQA